MQKVLDAMGFAVIVMQGDAFCDVNPAAALSGYSRKELMGMPFWELAHPEYRDEVKATGFLYQSEKIAPQCREIKIIRKDGREVWLLAVVSSMEINGRPAAVAALVEMPARRAWESRLHYIIDDSPDLISRWREGGILTYVNKAHCRFFGKTREELIGKSFLPLVPEGELQDVRQSMSTLTPENPRVEKVHRLVDRDGKTLWIHWIIQCIVDREGRVIEFQSVGRDITAQRGAEAEREDYRMHMEAIFNTVPDAIVTVDRDMRVLQHNEAFKLHSGLTEPVPNLRLCDIPIACSRACH